MTVFAVYSLLLLRATKTWRHLLIFVQFVESRGIHVIPYSYFQRRFKSASVTSALRDNVAFKLSFGLTFALAAFAEF